MHLKEVDAFKMDIQNKTNSLRKITCECGLLTRSDGSCCFQQGNTVIMASVTGPVEVRANKEHIARAYIEVTYKPKVGLQGCEEKSQEKFISSACESVISVNRHPRSQFSIVLQEMEKDGSLTSCCVNATCMALLNAAVPLNYLMAAVTVVITKVGELVLDPTDEQEADALANMTFVFSSTDLKVLACNCYGQYSQEQYQQCLLICTEASKQVFQFYRSTMEKRLSATR